MQDVFKQIYDLAVSEVPHRIFYTDVEICVLYKGFKIAKRGKDYYWYDCRYSNLYDPVDPFITERIIETRSFEETLTLVRLHNDEERIDILRRKIQRLDNEIEDWVNEATKAYNEYRKETERLDKSRASAHAKKRKREEALRKFDKKKRLYDKKRRILIEEKDAIRLDKVFYESRIKLFNN